mgnify:CR=1 FL=1
MANASKTPDRHGQLLEIADNLLRHLEREREDGVAVVDADPAEVKQLSELPPPVQDDTQAALNVIAKEAAGCKKCALHRTRTKVVPGQGAMAPEIMFVGEAPGFDEDQQGLAFVGRAGQLLTRMIEAMGFKREDVFIANILKCRPPENRTPMPDEMAACLPYLRAQIALLKPKVIVALGGTAVRGLVGDETGITKLRGKWLEFEGIPTMPTLHPAYLLRNPPAKMDVWTDMQEVLRRIGRKPPVKSGSKVT